MAFVACRVDARGQRRVCVCVRVRICLLAKEFDRGASLASVAVDAHLGAFGGDSDGGIVGARTRAVADMIVVMVVGMMSEEEGEMWMVNMVVMLLLLVLMM